MLWGGGWDMSPWFSLAGVLAVFTAALHEVMGGRLILGPLRAGAHPTRFAVVEAVWHLLTWHILAAALALFYLAFHPAGVLADVLLLHWVGYAAGFLVLSCTR